MGASFKITNIFKLTFETCKIPELVLSLFLYEGNKKIDHNSAI